MNNTNDAINHLRTYEDLAVLRRARAILQDRGLRSSILDSAIRTLGPDEEDKAAEAVVRGDTTRYLTVARQDGSCALGVAADLVKS